MSNDCLANITGASKRYGKTVALDGLDLQVRSGEAASTTRAEWSREDDSDFSVARTSAAGFRFGDVVWKIAAEPGSTPQYRRDDAGGCAV